MFFLCFVLFTGFIVVVLLIEVNYCTINMVGVILLVIKFDWDKEIDICVYFVVYVINYIIFIWVV